MLNRLSSQVMSTISGNFFQARFSKGGFTNNKSRFTGEGETSTGERNRSCTGIMPVNALRHLRQNIDAEDLGFAEKGWNVQRDPRNPKSDIRPLLRVCQYLLLRGGEQLCPHHQHLCHHSAESRETGRQGIRVVGRKVARI